MTTHHEEASRWFAASRRGVMSLEERQRFNAWMTNAANASAFGDMQRVWSSLDGVPAGAAVDASHNFDARQPKRAAMLLAACVASLSISILSYGGDSQFWTALDWATR